jgi:hypothetical protein
MFTTVSKCVDWLLACPEAAVPGGTPAREDLTEEEKAGLRESVRRQEEEDREALRRVEKKNAATDELIGRGIKEGKLACPHCGARAKHHFTRHKAPRLSYLVCRFCSRSFMGW